MAWRTFIQAERCLAAESAKNSEYQKEKVTL
jgi:hypothetical protein